jgi:ligand-binding sensor protein
MHQVLLIGFTLPLIFNLLISFTRCHTGLMMYSIHIDESVIHVSIAARPSRLYVPFTEKLNSLLDHLDNQRTMHSSQNGAVEWVRGNQNDAHYRCHATLHGL